ncbi:MAG TPA: hypothetical protein VHO50_05830 [Bacteroidales bacterium]|nr:hypothetical protein [Bacteroidales bacterium]
MKHLSINTAKKQNGSTIDNGFSFPDYSGSTNIIYSATSTSNQGCKIKYLDNQTDNLYAICVDWIEFICSCDEPIELAYINNSNANIVIEKISVHRNPNFRNLHRVYFNRVEACDIYSCPNNSTHAFNEVSVKIANVLLYTVNYHHIIYQLLNVFGLTFVRYARFDIALDGTDILNQVNMLNKWAKSHTVQLNNNAISILPTAFNKKEHHWLSWSVGKGKSGISARLYDKSNEIAHTKKEYITDFWRKNGLPTASVGRFEIQLNYKRLKRYQLNMVSLENLSDAGFVGAIFTNEVKSWLRFYRVRKKDMLNHKKEYAIGKGKEIQFIKWERIPVKMELLQIDNHITNGSVINARNNISFNLREILKHPDTSTTAQVEVIHKYANDYLLQDYVKSAIKNLFHGGNNNQYIALLNYLMDEDVGTKKQ